MNQDIIVNSNGGNIYTPNIISFEERQIELEKIEEKEEKQRQLNERLRKNSPFSNFYQFNRDFSKQMIWLAGKNAKAHQILLFLLDQMDSYNALMCSYKVIQEALGISESTAKRGIKLLKEHGFIGVYRSGSSNIYAVNKNLACEQSKDIQIECDKVKQVAIKE